MSNNLALSNRVLLLLQAAVEIFNAQRSHTPVVLLRGSLAQSLARELGPQGIHVAHPIIDGAIDTAFIRDNFPERYALKDQAGILAPDHIAEQYWQLHCQPRDCWTHELDLRPWMETF